MEEDCDSRAALVTATAATDKKKGLLRGLLRLGKLAKRESGKPGSSRQPTAAPAPPSTAVKRRPASPARVSVPAHNAEQRPDVSDETPREPA